MTNSHRSARHRSARSSLRRAALALTSAGAAIALVASTNMTTAGFTDSTFAAADLVTMTPSLTIAPVPYNQSFGSTLYLNDAGEVYLTGDRTTGDGAGKLNTAATAPPTKVAFPSDVRIVDAIGSTNDFTVAAATPVRIWPSEGKVWTWGQPWGGRWLIGRGQISVTEAAAPGVVSRTNDNTPLPKIASIRRIENQFLALDYDGRLWAWGYGGENLPIVSAAKGNYAYPVLANSTTLTHGYAVYYDTGPFALGNVRWRSIWSGKNVDGAVAQNGLIYTWGWENTDGLTPGASSDTCPTANEGLNRAVFQAYPGIYTTADGSVYDETALPTEPERHQRFLDILDNMKDATVCPGVNTGIVIDNSGCPVRQLAFHAASMHLLTADGQLFAVSLRRVGEAYQDRGWLRSLLGRASDEDATSPNYAYRPQTVRFPDTSATVSSLSSGIGHVTAVLDDGSVWGWGINRYCQAIGGPGPGRTAKTCSTFDDADLVSTPMRIAGLDGVNVQSVSASACSTWATGTDGSLYVWGGGTISGYVFYLCNANGNFGYPSFDFTDIAPNAPFANPITVTSTATRRIYPGADG